jgi:hypothetical protein
MPNAAQRCLYDPMIGPCLNGEKAGGKFGSVEVGTRCRDAGTGGIL